MKARIKWGRKHTVPQAGRVVWRISEATPLGEYVQTGALPSTNDAQATPVPVPPLQAAAEPVHARGWHHSSHDLCSGADVSEAPLESLPEALVKLLRDDGCT